MTEPANRRAAASPEYAAFISYRHLEPDESTARWLVSALESYRVPASLSRARDLPRRLGKVCRDRDEMPASSDLGARIEKSLEDSGALIVVCSPRTPESRWVDREVEFFQELGRGDRIFAVLVAGEPHESFPPALRDHRDESTESTSALSREVVPLAADLREATGRQRRRVRRGELLRLVAGLLGVGHDELVRRDRMRRQRRLAIGGGIVACILVGFLLLLGRVSAEKRARRAAETERLALRLAEAAESEHAAGRHERAALLARRAWLVAAENHGAGAPRTYRALRRILAGAPLGIRLNLDDGEQAGSLAVAPDGKAVAAGATGPEGAAILVWDLSPGDSSPPLRIPRAREPRWIGITPDGGKLVGVGPGGGVTVWSREDLLAPPLEFVPEPRLHPGERPPAFLPDGRELAFVDTSLRVRLLDIETGTSRALPGYAPEGETGGLQCSLDGRRLAVSGETGRVHIWDLASRRVRPEYLEVVPEEEPVQIAFLEGGRALAAHVRGAGLRRFDLDARESSDGETGKPVLLPQRPSDVRGLASQGRELILFSLTDPDLLLVEPGAEGSEIQRLAGLRSFPAASPASDREGRIVAATDGSEIRVWNRELVDRGRSLSVLEGVTSDAPEDQAQVALPMLGFAGVGDLVHVVRDSGEKYVAVAMFSSLAFSTGEAPIRRLNLPDLVEIAPALPFSGPAPFGGSGLGAVFFPGREATSPGERFRPPQIESLAVGGDGRYLAGATTAGPRIWDLADPAGAPRAPPGAAPTASAIALSAQAPEFLLAAAGKARIDVWRRDGAALRHHRLAEGTGEVRDLAFDASTELLAAGLESGELRVYLTDTEERGPRSVKLGDEPVHRVAFRPSSRTLAAAAGRRVHLLEAGDDDLVETGRRELEEGESVADIAFTPDGEYLIVGTEGIGPTHRFGDEIEWEVEKPVTRGVLLLYDLGEGREEVLPLLAASYGAGVRRIAVDPDGEGVALVTADLHVHSLRVHPRNLAEAVPRLVRRRLTPEELDRLVGE